MKPIPYIIPVSLAIAGLCFSCEPFEKVSDVPEIHFKSYEAYQLDTIGNTIVAGELIFSFQDGNADFGLDTTLNPLDTINFFMIPYSKVDGIYDSINADLYGRKYAIYRNDRLDRTGQNKTIRGDIKLQIYYFIPPPYDTIRYDFYIVDRAGNESNVESTSDIVFLGK
jgi:hypothetical protein